MSEQTVQQGFFDGHKLGKHQLTFLWIIAFAYAFEFIDSSLFGYATPALMTLYGMSMSTVSQLASINMIGMFFGSFFSGWLTEKLGRKPGLLINIFIFTIASVMTALYDGGTFGTVMVFFARFLSGFGVVGMTITAMVYISEMMPSEHRGKYQALTIACGTAFTPLTAILANKILGMGTQYWHWLFIISAATFVMIPIGLIYLKESPRWLVSKGRVQEAENIVYYCVGERKSLKIYADNAQKLAAEQKANQIGALQTLKIMFGPKYRKRTLAVVPIMWITLAGNLWLINHFPALMIAQGMAYATYIMSTAITSWGTPAGDLFVSFISDKGGRTIPIVICCAICGFAFCGIGFVGSATIPFIILMFIKCMFAGGTQTLAWTYLSESYPTAIRSNASGFIMASARIVIAIMMLLVPLLIAHISITVLFCINGILYLIAAILVGCFGEKTAQVSLEELEARAEARIQN